MIGAILSITLTVAVQVEKFPHSSVPITSIDIGLFIASSQSKFKLLDSSMSGVPKQAVAVTMLLILPLPDPSKGTVTVAQSKVGPV